MSTAKNVRGGPLQPCSTKPLTGFYRNGCCDTGYEDTGLHLICVETTAQFLAFSASRGNDLSTPFPHYGFPGLKPGDRWCLCATRWVEAYEAGVAPKVVIEATHISMLEFADLETLEQYSTDAEIPF